MEMRRSIYTGLVAMVLLAAAAPAADAKPVKWKRNGHLYEVLFVKAGVTWQEAQSRVQKRGCGWYLATITSAAENNFVFKLARQKKPAVFDAVGGSGPWIGGLQPSGSPEPAGGWSWITGEPFQYTNWNPGEPNNSGDEGYINTYRNGTWNDTKATDRLQGLIIEFDKARQRQCQMDDSSD
jgi:hypothetical protein